ncbi:MAG: SGNH/GDSL hydrolase family protein [Bacteroidales bacterium]|nr:SGNH/GDSL hydrolase family protein [Bacteroidales bacterium]
MKRFLKYFYYIIVGGIIIGMLLQQSDEKQIFNYSYIYFGITIVTAFFLIFIPFLIRYLIKKIGAKNLLFSVIPTLVILLIIYFFFHYRYYYQLESPVRAFDPFLQAPPPQFDVNIEKDTNEFRIIALGGSTTRCNRLEEQYRYPQVLKNILSEAYPSRKITVLNAGMDWYTTQHSLINYITYCSDFNPDLVVVMHSINDIYRSFESPFFSMGEFNDRYSNFYGPAINAARPPAPETFEKNFIKQLYYSFMNLTDSAASVSKEFLNQIAGSEEDIAFGKYRSYKPFKKYFSKLFHYINSDSVDCVLVLQPSIYKDTMTQAEYDRLWFGKLDCFENGVYPSPASLAEAMDKFNSAAKAIAIENNIDVVDGAANIPKTLDYFTDDVHYTNEGAAKLAELVAEQIINSGVIERKVKNN